MKWITTSWTDGTNTNIIIGNAYLFISVDQHSFCDSDNNRVDRDYTLHKLSGTLTPNFMGLTNLVSFYPLHVRAKIKKKKKKKNIYTIIKFCCSFQFSSR